MGSLPGANAAEGSVTPNFTLLLATGVVFAIPVLAFIWWRFGGPDTVAFVIVSGLFTAIMDFISAFVAQNYEYPGQSRLWVFTFIFFGWIGMCGSCLFIAEGIFARPGRDMLTQPQLWWVVPLATGLIAVVVDLFIDPVAVAIGYWVWYVQGNVYYGIPLLNFVGWFVLMFLAPLAWVFIARRRHWGYTKKTLASLVALVPLFAASVVLSLALNGIVAAFGLR
jgi:putative membrane protein